MGISWFVFFTWCIAYVTSFDLGPIIRTAQCRSQCLRKHTVDGNCDWYSGQQQTTCSMCWQYCEAFENRWEKTRTVCEGDQYLHCPACQTACIFRKTRVEEKYLPSMLPAPKKSPINLDKFDVAVVMRKLYKQWRVDGYYPGDRVPNLRPDTWIIVAVEDGVRHYSWQEWVPKLDSLKKGPLYEATISWTDVQNQLQKQRSLEQVSSAYNDRVEKDQSGNKESYVVSWEPESGGLMGNQVADSNSAQISLLPGTKYLVRIASNDGPGSFPIEVDTRPSSVQAEKMATSLLPDLYPWDIFAASVSAAVLVVVVGMYKVCRKSKDIEVEEV
ncbi:hypothetical protein WN55_07144 [Dufourea novaeangliae]|uniref:Fibronectin type-III domain-containing protein n=1 Tax=Dufourea novaeangliae TaxID=178035 RepID=A0A154P4B2_DUFNO|nr:hypothetical protein WN55_07144 [Dufourea novaeangliae]